VTDWRVLIISILVSLSGVCSMYPIACRTKACTACFQANTPQHLTLLC
jgi:hypothetical protein